MFGVILSKFMCGWKDGRCTVYLGFIGKEYTTARKILPRNLTGNSAFRSVK